MNTDLNLTSRSDPAREFLTAAENISALELVPTDPGMHSGQFTVIPKNARLQVCGQGFNERTVKVRWGNRLCYVFLQDVSPVEIGSHA